MMKNLVFSMMVVLAASSLSAAESTVTYTNATGEFRTWGRFKSQIYDVAIHISDPVLVGKKITAVRALLNADEGLEATSVWLSKDLTLEKVDGVKVTVPDTYSSEVPVEKVSVAGIEGSCGQLSATLDTPYQLTDEGIYVGYSLTVPSAGDGESLSDKLKQPILVSPCGNPESLYVRASKDFMTWKPFYENILAGAAIYVSLEGEFDEYSLGIKDLAEAYAPVGEDFSVRSSVSNIGAHEISQIAYSYSVAGREFDAVLNLEVPIVPDFVASSQVSFPIAGIHELGEYDLGLKIKEINGNANSCTMASASTYLSVVPFVPVHRPLLEEFTGTWCGWCTRGYYALETLDSIYGDSVVLAAYHTNDPMAAASLPVSISGCPSAVLNRGKVQDPYFGEASVGFGMKSQVEASMNTLAGASIEVSAEWTDEGKTAISVLSASRFIKDETNAGYKVGYILVNDGLTGEGAGWIQSNSYHNYASVYTGTELEILTTWPENIIGMTFNDVVVDCEAIKGVEGSIPSIVAVGESYGHEISFDIADNTVIQDKDRLRVIAFIIGDDGSIVNSNKCRVKGLNAVGAFSEEVTEVSVEYYDLAGRRVSAPHEGIFIKVSRMSDGSMRTRKIGSR